MSQTRPFVLTVFGATGFTGRLTAEYLARVVGSSRPWAIAGRSRAKLDEVRRALIDIDPSCEAVGVVEASAEDPITLARMAAETSCVVTTVGPYARHGLPVVEACVAGCADYADITGEPQFVAEVIARFDGAARDKGLRIVNTCGFDSVPHDLGALYTVKLLPRDVPIELEGFVRSRGTASGGTWQSALNAFANLRSATASMRPPRPADGRRVGGLRQGIRYDTDLGAWAAPLPTIDPAVVLRSAAVMPEYGPDFRYAHNAEVHSAATLVGGIAGVGAVVALSQVGVTRRWLASLRPSGDGPSEAQRAKSWFTVTFRGKGGGRTVVTRVSGGDPGYTETSKMLAESALALTVDHDTLPDRHGVLTPAAAMGERLTARLQAAGIRFEVLRG